jgi:hypothetical protein
MISDLETCCQGGKFKNLSKISLGIWSLTHLWVQGSPKIEGFASFLASFDPIKGKLSDK